MIFDGMSEVRTIIFDYGGVIMTSAQEEAVRRFRVLGINPSQLPLDKYSQTGLFGALEEGRITKEEFREQLSSLAGHELSHEDCLWACLGYVKEIPKRNIRLLRVLRQRGYRLLLLSNTNAYMMSWAMSSEFVGEGGALSDYLDKCYCSYEVGKIKPDPDFFQYVLKQENLIAEETLFVDDNEKNVAVARSFGMKTLQPVNGEDWTGNLLELLSRYSQAPVVEFS